MPEELKEYILKVLSELPANEKFSVSRIHTLIGDKMSYPTLLKWLLVLEAEKRINVEDYGRIKFITLNNGKTEVQ